MDKLKKFLNIKYLTLVALIVFILITISQIMSKSNTIDEKSTKQQTPEVFEYNPYALEDAIYKEMYKIIPEVQKDNTISPNERENKATEKCIQFVLNNQYLKEKYDNRLDKMVAIINEKCQKYYINIKEFFFK